MKTFRKQRIVSKVLSVALCLCLIASAFTGIPFREVKEVSAADNYEWTEDYIGNPISQSFYKTSSNLTYNSKTKQFSGKFAKGNEYQLIAKGKVVGSKKTYVSATITWVFKIVESSNNSGTFSLTSGKSHVPSIYVDGAKGEINQSVTIKANSGNMYDNLGFVMGLGDIDKGQTIAFKNISPDRYSFGKSIRQNGNVFTSVESTDSDNHSGDSPFSKMGVVVGNKVKVATSYSFDTNISWSTQGAGFTFNLVYPDLPKVKLSYHPNGGVWQSTVTAKKGSYNGFKKGSKTIWTHSKTNIFAPVTIANKKAEMNQSTINKVIATHTYKWYTTKKNSEGKVIKKNYSKKVTTKRLVKTAKKAKTYTYTYAWTQPTNKAPVRNKAGDIIYETKITFECWKDKAGNIFYPNRANTPLSMIADSNGNKSGTASDNSRHLYAEYKTTITPIAPKVSLTFKANGGKYNGTAGGDDPTKFEWTNAHYLNSAVKLTGNRSFAKNYADDYVSPTTAHETNQTFQGIAAKNIPIPVRPGYRFLGYSTTPTETPNFPESNTGNEAFPAAGFKLTSRIGNYVYAKWQKIQPNVSVISDESYTAEELEEIADGEDDNTEVKEDAIKEEHSEGDYTDDIQYDANGNAIWGYDDDNNPIPVQYDGNGNIIPLDVGETEEDNGPDETANDIEQDTEQDLEEDEVDVPISDNTPKYDTDLSKSGREGFVYNTDTFVYMWVDVKVDCAVLGFYSGAAASLYSTSNGSEYRDETAVGGIWARFSSEDWGDDPRTSAVEGNKLVSDKFVMKNGTTQRLFIGFRTPKYACSGLINVEIMTHAPHGYGMTNFIQNDDTYEWGETNATLAYQVVEKKENTPPDTNFTLPENVDADKDGYVDNHKIDAEGKNYSDIKDQIEDYTNGVEYFNYTAATMPAWFSLNKAYDNRPTTVNNQRNSSWTWWASTMTLYTSPVNFEQKSASAAIPGTYIKPAFNSGKNLIYRNMTGKASIGSGIAEIKLGDSSSELKSTLREIKSGYGVEVNQKAVVNSSGTSTMKSGTKNVSMLIGTKPQSGIAYFPEFLYQKGGLNGVSKPFNRLLELTGTGDDLYLDFTKNAYSPAANGESSRYHFTPLWYPNSFINKYYAEGGATAAIKRPYTVYIESTDSWTPSGKLTSAQYSAVAIEKNLTYDSVAAPGEGGDYDDFNNDAPVIDEKSK
ncbi:MAG: hypothetical protein LBD17_03095 [Endomicrobium sp.]|nr:hypothetical protein [Endomicrobium sp.]